MIETLTPPAHYREQNAEVFYSDRQLVTLGPEDLAFLKAQARRNPRLRSRLCAHPDPSAAVHEMMIVHHRDVYVRPHQHVAKSESFHLIEGHALVVLFDEDGTLAAVIPVGDAASGRASYFRMPERAVHTFVIESEWLVFHETTSGPFDPNGTVFAPWSPDGSDAAAAAAFLAGVRQQAQARLDAEG